MPDEIRVPDQARSDRMPRRRLRLTPWWIRAHKWAALTVGLVLLLQTTSGAVLLMQPEIMRWTHPDRFQSTASAHPLTGIEALALVDKQRPDLHPVSATLFRNVWLVRASPDHGVVNTAYVDPGTGTINAVGTDTPWIMRMAAQPA